MYVCVVKVFIISTDDQCSFRQFWNGRCEALKFYAHAHTHTHTLLPTHTEKEREREKESAIAYFNFSVCLHILS